jgi:uncharacterized protein with HEPN domain
MLLENRTLDDIKDKINEIEECLQGIGFADFHSSRRRMIFVVHRLESILISMESFDEDFRGKYTELPWDEVMQYRKLILKGNSEIDEKEVWNISKIKLVRLKKILDSINYR